MTIQEFFEQETAHPVVADFLLLKTFGPDYYTWEPETLLRELRLEFKAVPNSANFGCIQAVRAVHTSNRYQKDWFIFEKICTALNNQIVLFTVGQQQSLGNVLAAVDALNGSPEGIPGIRKTTFGEDVKKYMAAVIISDGTYPVPDTLKFCEEFVPRGTPNNNAQDDEQYRLERVKLCLRQINELGLK